METRNSRQIINLRPHEAAQLVKSRPIVVDGWTINTAAESSLQSYGFYGDPNMNDILKRANELLDELGLSHP